jgi:hypothetical protein
MGSNQWPQILNGAVWLPIVLLCWFRYLNGPGRFVWAACAGAAGGMAVLAGHHIVPEVVLTSVFGALAYKAWEKRRTLPRWTRYGLGMAVFALFLFLLSAVQTLPSMEFWKQAVRFVNAKEPVTWSDPIPYSVHRHYSLDPSSLPGVVVLGLRRDAPYEPFIGLAVFSLALIGFACFRQQSAARLLGFLALLGLLLSIGESSVLHGIFFALFPLFEKARNPSMLIAGFHLPLVVLAGFGVQALWENRPSRKWGRWFGVVGGLALAAVFVLYMADPGKARLQPGAMMFGLVALSMAALLLAPMRAHNRAIFAALLTFYEIGSTTTNSYPDREMGFPNLEALRRSDEIAGYLRRLRETEPFRFQIEDGVTPANFGDWHGLEQTSGYMGISVNLYREHWRPQVAALLGTKYYVGPKAKDQFQRSMFEVDGIHVWEASEYAPRVWTAHRFEIISIADAPARYQQGWPAMRDTVFAFSGNATVAECNGDKVETVRLAPESANLRASMQCDGLVILNTAYQPGWIGFIDGRRVDVIEAYGKILAVPVPAGTHTVSFHYAAWSVQLGLALSIAGLCGLSLLWISDRRGWEFPGLRRSKAT